MELKTLAFEIGTEELPAFALHDAMGQLDKLVNGQKGFLFPHESTALYSTPRRIIVMVNGVPEMTQEVREEYRGPSAKIAYDADGNPTKAAMGFARGKGLTVDDLERREENGVEYVYAVKQIPARKVAELLPGILSDIFTSISWPKVQRWGSHSEQFSRPVRWIMAMLGDEVIPVSFAGVESGNQTYGHRFLAPGPYALSDASELIDVLQSAYVVPSEDLRRASIEEQVARIEEETGLVADLPAKTMQEVVNLCEYPTVMVGSFDPLFLEVPKEITVDAMLVHQRYFPLFDQEGKLTNKYLITSNGNPEFEANIVDGNNRVVAARLYDAKFFYDEDRKHPLDYYVDLLDQVVFQESLGTTLAKTHRIEALAAHMADDLAMPQDERDDVARAAHLCKADLVTGAVVEFTSVQGIMGYYYALAGGENERVATAIADHYRPRFSGDALPETMVGKVVAAADKLDTICGLFAVNQGPTGSSDPFGLRRSAIGIIAMLQDGLNISLSKAIDVALQNYGRDGISFDFDQVKQTVIEFFRTRTIVSLRDSGYLADTIDAVLSVIVDEPLVLISRVKALEEARKTQIDIFTDLATAYARANNLRDGDLGMAYDESLMNDHEKALSAAIFEAEAPIAQALAAGDYAAGLKVLSTLRQPIDDFFANVMVMDEDLAIRQNRLRLLNRFISVFANLADFGKMAKTSK